MRRSICFSPSHCAGVCTIVLQVVSCSWLQQLTSPVSEERTSVSPQLCSSGLELFREQMVERESLLLFSIHMLRPSHSLTLLSSEFSAPPWKCWDLNLSCSAHLLLSRVELMSARWDLSPSKVLIWTSDSRLLPSRLSHGICASFTSQLETDEWNKKAARNQGNRVL